MVRKWWRVMRMKFALRRRRTETARTGMCIYNAYMLCRICGAVKGNDGFKPGKKAELEHEMEQLARRIDLIEARLAKPWWRWA